MSATERIPALTHESPVPLSAHAGGTRFSLVYQAKQGRVPDVPFSLGSGYRSQTSPKNGYEWVRRGNSAGQTVCTRARGLEMTFPRMGTPGKRHWHRFPWSEAAYRPPVGVPILRLENGYEWVRGALEVQRGADTQLRPP